jgi:hypothetical protein
MITLTAILMEGDQTVFCRDNGGGVVVKFRGKYLQPLVKLAALGSQETEKRQKQQVPENKLKRYNFSKPCAVVSGCGVCLCVITMVCVWTRNCQSTRFFVQK